MPYDSSLVRNWGWVLADGVLGVIVGILSLAWPGITVLALAVLLGIGLLVQGGVEVYAGLKAHSGTQGRGWTIAFGVLAVVAGIICLVSPSSGLFAIVVGVTIWFLAAGINELVAGFTLREGRGWNIVMGILSIIAAIIVIVQPGIGLSTAAFVVGLLFIVRGVGEIALAVNLRRVAKAPLTA